MNKAVRSQVARELLKLLPVLALCCWFSACTVANRAATPQTIVAPEADSESISRLKNMRTMDVQMTVEPNLLKAMEEDSLRTQFERLIKNKGFLICDKATFCVPEATFSASIKHDPRVPLVEWYSPTHLIVSVIVVDSSTRELMYQNSFGVRWMETLPKTFTAILQRVTDDLPESKTESPVLIGPLY